MASQSFKRFIQTLHKILSHLIHKETGVTDVLKNRRDKNEISIEQYKDFSSSGPRP